MYINREKRNPYDSSGKKREIGEYHTVLLVFSLLMIVGNVCVCVRNRRLTLTGTKTKEIYKHQYDC